MKIYIIMFLSFTLFACKTNENISSISDRVTNASNKIVSIVKSEKTKKSLRNQNLKKSKINSNLNNHLIKFVEWECGTFFLLKPVLNVGYFPNYKSGDISVGALTLESNEEMFPAFHEVNGIDNSFMWGGGKLNDYKIVIKPDNTAYYYDFSNAKRYEIRESQQTLKCNKKTFNLEKEEFQNYTNSFKNIFKKYGFNFD
tara:strand:- start:112 stop:708 length:597 start_codon:yes stop_codon:yes gene_type:complete